MMSIESPIIQSEALANKLERKKQQKRESVRREIDFDRFNEKQESRNHLLILEDIIKFFKIEDRNRAIDIGAGALREAKFLVDEGFREVVVIDYNELKEQWKEDIDMKKVKIIKDWVEDYSFEKESCELIISLNTLPWVKKDELQNVIEGIKNAFKKRGIFVGNFFATDEHMVVEGMSEGEKANGFSKKEIEKLFIDFELIKVGDVDGIDEYKGITKINQDGKIKDVIIHDFLVIVRKK
jgi:hypothetical protein